VSRLLNFLKPAPYLPEIEDSAEVKKKYDYWRIRIFYSMFIGYALYYVTRKSFTFAMPAIATDLGFDKSDLGILGSIFAISYGISKFASGVIADQTNPRYFMALGLFMTGFVNILFGFSSSIFLFALFWGMNGFFQGIGWPPCARYLTQWYSKSERGSWWSTWNLSHNVGAFMIPWMAGFLIFYFDWRWAMYIPGIICIFGGVFLVNRLRDTPQSLGLPPVEKFRNDYSDVSEGSDERMSPKRILCDFIINNKYIWILACAYFFVYVVRQGVNDWTAYYLKETKDYSSIVANGTVSLFEIGGMFGALVAGWSSDRLFKTMRGPVNALFAVGLFAAIMGYWYVETRVPLYDSIAIFVIGFMVFGPQMLIGVQAAELCPKNAAATATGFIGTFAYLGAAVSGYPVGYVTQRWGWDGFFWFMAVCASLSVLLLIPLWSISKKSIENKKAVEYA
jgi:OPA family sugar phosphate sensor protein UhpC-like MFS transporter